MPDTMRKCSDCGEKGCEYKYWGPLVPEKKVAGFCKFCFGERKEAYKKGIPPKPLGVRPPGIPYEFRYMEIQVTTKNDSIYELNLMGRINERIISCNREKLHFTRARVICLRIGRNLVLRPRDGSKDDLWYTSPVVSIKEK